MSDSTLTEALREGSIDSFKTIYNAFYPRVRGFAFRLTRTEWIADEIAQDVFVKLWTHRQSLLLAEGGGNLSGYIFRIARNEVVSHYRRRRMFVDAEQAFAEQLRTDERLEERIDAAGLASLVDRIVAAMPPVRREVFRMSRYKLLANDEIARALGISKRTVEKHISVALEQLRQALRSRMR